MLDKSIPFYRIILKRRAGTPLPEAELPPGYRFSFYQPGDEKAWGEIETSVLEFETVADAIDRFRKEYVPYETEVTRRTLFVERDDGFKVGTFTAWWGYTGQRRHPWMHWVSVRPEFQGLGLGKALVARGVQLMVELEGDCDMYIPTQTWSHRAIRLYQWAGFDLLYDEVRPGGMENQTAEGVPLIKHLL